MSKFKLEQTTLRITISLGVALYKPDIALKQLMQTVDKKLYKAKRQGRNCVVV